MVMRPVHLWCVLWSVAGYLALVWCQSFKEVMVKVREGQLRGYYSDGVTYFTGIPYAVPPVEDLRFQAPKPAVSWQGVRNATSYSNACVQFANPDLPKDLLEFIAPTNQDEDCLYLDVYIPGDINSSRTLPVLVFIHGGGFTLGSASTYNASYLAMQGDIIVVNINYRLGALGFLSLEHPDTPGNVALLDQHLALQWIKNNIAAFGGSPDQITIYGESAGSFSVSMHILSPLSKGLFHKAIASSGVVTGYLMDRKTAAVPFAQVAEQIGCDVTSSDSTLACLRALNVTELVQAFWMVNIWPIMDGNFIAKQPPELWQSGEFNKVPVVTGFTDEDGSVMMLVDGQMFNTGVDTSMVPAIVATTIAVLTYIPDMKKNTAAALTNTYYFMNTSDPLVNLRSCLDFARDSFMAAPAVKMAKVMSAVGVPVYMYEFAEKIYNAMGYQGISSSVIPLGAMHGDDIPHVFGIALFNLPEALRPGKIEFSDNLINSFASFVKSSSPVVYLTDGGETAWKAYREDDPTYVYLKINDTSFKKNPAQKGDLIWNTIISSVTAKTDCPVNKTMDTDTEPVVTTRSGKLKGLRQYDNSTGFHFEAYYGVPYAEAPVQELRFKKPQAVKAWQGVKDARYSGYACPQEGDQTKMNEDCLTLNIWVPGESGDTKKYLPVLVFIPGDGSSSTDMRGLALHGQVLVVKVQYRLGLLAGVSTGDSVAPGNLGHWDVLLALRWINDNIGYFGGDTSSITLAGHSGGAVLATTLMLSPRAKALFQQVIAMSGSVLSATAIERRATEKVDMLASKLDCNQTSVAEEVECLRHITWPTLMKVAGDLGLMSWHPHVDGTLLEDMPHRLLNQSHLKQLGFLGGSISTEGRSTVGAMTPEQAVDAELQAAYPGNQVIGPAVTQLYFTSGNSLGDYAQYRRDSMYASGVELLAHAITRQGGKAYVYVSSFNSSKRAGPARHGDDVDLVAGLPLVSNAFSSEEVKLAENLLLYFSNFISTGDPNRDRTVLAPWPVYDTNKPYLKISSNMAGAAVSFRQREQYFNFWNTVFPLLVVQDNYVCFDADHIIQSDMDAEEGESCMNTRPTQKPDSCDDEKSGKFNATKDQLDAALIAMIVVAAFFLLLLIILIVALCVTSRKSSPRRYNMNNGKTQRTYVDSFM